MTYLDAPSGVGVQAGVTVSVVASLVGTVPVWPAPVPALILTGRPAHWPVVHGLVMSWNVVGVCLMTYFDVPSGVVAQAGETGSVLVVLDITVLVWPAPAPAVIVTRRVAHWLIGHALVPGLVVSWSVVVVCLMTYLDVPSGVVGQAGETVSVVAVLKVTVLV